MTEHVTSRRWGGLFWSCACGDVFFSSAPGVAQKQAHRHEGLMAALAGLAESAERMRRSMEANVMACMPST